MLLRKRAWDIMRNEYTRIDADAGVADVMRTLDASLRKDPEEHVALAFAEHNEFLGTVSVWSVLRFLEKCVFSHENADAESSEEEGSYWDRIFERACNECCEAGIEHLINTKPPMVHPSDALLIVAEKFIKHRLSYAVVAERDNVVGIIYRSDLYLEITSGVMNSLKSS